MGWNWGDSFNSIFNSSTSLLQHWELEACCLRFIGCSYISILFSSFINLFVFPYTIWNSMAFKYRTYYTVEILTYNLKCHVYYNTFWEEKWTVLLDCFQSLFWSFSLKCFVCLEKKYIYNSKIGYFWAGNWKLWDSGNCSDNVLTALNLRKWQNV